MSDIDHERLLDADAMLELDRARASCGLHAGPLPECLEPEIERAALDAFRRLAELLEALAASKPKGEAA